MKFKLIDYINFVKLDSTLYSIEVFVTPLNMHDYLLIVEKLKYFCRKDNISFLSVYSTTESKSAKLVITHTGKRGRPQKTILGKKIDGHTHTIIKGNNCKSAYSTAKKIKKSIDKHYDKPVCKIVSKSDNIHAFNYIGYCIKQSDVLRTGGNFDFINYYKEHS